MEKSLGVSIPSAVRDITAHIPRVIIGNTRKYGSAKQLPKAVSCKYHSLHIPDLWRRVPVGQTPPAESDRKVDTSPPGAAGNIWRPKPWNSGGCEEVSLAPDLYMRVHV